MSTYPNAIDTDATLPAVNDNIDQIGEEAINALRDAVFQIETALGTNIAGTQPSLAARLGVFINQDGTPNTSVLYNLGLVTLPVTNNQIAPNAGIPESKLHLDFRTQDLYNYIRDLAKDVNLAIGWISVSGVKLEPHLIGAIYRHDLAQIDVAETSSEFLNNVFRAFRNNTDAYTLIDDINNELLAHQWADGSAFGTIQNIVTNNGSVYPSSYAHVASGIYLNTSGFAVIPETAQSVQAFADYIDGASILTLGTRIQNLYANGISRNSQSSNLVNDGYGQAIVPLTPAIAFLRGNGNNSSPVDSITIGDDIIQLLPSANDGYTFDEQFALVQPGDIITVNYSGDGYNVAIPFIISEKKYSYTGNSYQSYFVRIAGKNIAYAPNAVVQINRSLYNNNKYGVLSVASAVPTNATGNSILGASSAIAPSLIIGSPRGAQATGVGFSPDQFNESHYLLYLALYPTGNPLDGYTFLPGIDVTGNQGTTPGAYTIDSIVAATNSAFRQPGYNYRFTAFQFEGEFGIMLADSYANSAFSIVSAVVGGNGFYNQANTVLNFPNNVVDVFPLSAGTVAQDPLGFGPFAANLASPPFLTAYGSIPAALVATRLFVPLKRNNYYVNGNERETFPLDVSQAEDSYGDGYWVATIGDVSPNAGPPGVVTVTYNIPLDLSASGLKAGKTVVIQPLLNNYGLVNYGRYIIQSVNFTPCTPVETQITVFDAVHAQGGSPFPVAPIGSQVGLYLDAGSVSFDMETATDFSPITSNFKRHFEVYIDQNGETFTHERGRFSLNGNITVNGQNLYTSTTALAQMDLVRISPKLRGYSFGPLTKITLYIASLDPVGGFYTGNLASYDGATYTRPGPTVTGRIGEVVRFYDETNIDYIDVFFSTTNSLPTLSGAYVDVQLLPSLALDENIMILASCQHNTAANAITQLQDLRQFGNTSEEQFTTSALEYIAAPARHLNFNGVIRGFDLPANQSTGVAYGYGVQLSFTGGLALVNGNLIAIDDQAFIIPPLQEIYLSVAYPINYALCVNDENDLVTVVLTDYDAITGTPNVPNRVVRVNNPVSSTTYTVDSCTFSYLLNNRKDLTVLYVVSSAVTGSGSGTATTVTNTRDVRRNVKDSDSSIPAVVTNDNSQGNFETLIAAFNWISFNTTYQNTVYVKGISSINSNISFSPSQLNVLGGGAAAAITFNENVVANNTTFTNVNLNFFGAGSLTSNSCNFIGLTAVFTTTTTITNATFNNCTLTFAQGAILTNVTFNNCTVIFTTGTFTTQNVVFNTCSITQYVTFPSGVGISIIDSQVTVNTTRAFELGSNYTFEGSTFIWTVPTDGSYVTTDLINTGNAMFYSSLGANANITNLKVRDCIFNVALNSGVNRYGFFSFQFTDPTAYIQNIDISSNRFLTTAPSGSNDVRAVISFNSMLAITPVGQTNPSIGKSPTMFGVTVNNNFCNYDQMIAITSARLPIGPGFNTVVGPLVSTVDCQISGNTCGTIGFITASTLPLDASNSVANGLIRDRAPGLTIDKNNCKFISNLDNFGQYITFRLTYPDNGGNSSRHDLVIVSTGPATISNNTANWIQVGSGGYGEYITQATIAVGSNGVSLPTGSISVSSTVGFPTSGTIIVFTSAGAQGVTYTGTSGGNIFTGCTGGTGTMSTGGVVTFVTGTYDGLTIVNNTLFPSNPTYLNAFADTGNGSPMVPGNYGITIRREFNGTGPTKSIITGNKLIQKSTLASTGLTTNTYYYDQGILCINSAIVSNNSIVGCVNNTNDANAAMLSFYGSGNIIATENYLDRSGQTITGYVGQVPPAGAGSGNIVTIVNNTFDSQFVDTANTIENSGNNIPTAWNFSQNKNQVAYTSVDLNNASWFAYGTATQYSSTGVGVFPPYWDSPFPPLDEGGILFKLFAGGGTGITTLTSPGGAAGSIAAYAGGEIDLHNYLPDGVKLLYIVIGANFPNGSGSLGSGSETLQFTIYPTRTCAFTPGSFNGTMADPSVASGGGPLSSSYSSNLITMTPAVTPVSTYTFLDTSSLGIFASHNYGIILGVNAVFNTSACIMNMSPVVMKFIY